MMKQFVIFMGVLLTLFVSCTAENVDSDVLGETHEFSDSSNVIVASQNFQTHLSFFSQQVSPLLKGNVHTRTNEDGSVNQIVNLDSTSLSVANAQLEKLDVEGVGLIKTAGVSENDIREIMGDSIETGKMAIAAMIFSAMIHDDYVEPQTRALFKNRYLNCIADALGIDGALFAGTAIKYGVKTAAKICLKLALTGATGAGVYIFAISYTWCIYGY